MGEFSSGVGGGRKNETAFFAGYIDNACNLIGLRFHLPTTGIGKI